MKSECNEPSKGCGKWLNNLNVLFWMLAAGLIEYLFSTGVIYKDDRFSLLMIAVSLMLLLDSIIGVFFGELQVVGGVVVKKTSPGAFYFRLIVAFSGSVFCLFLAFV